MDGPRLPPIRQSNIWKSALKAAGVEPSRDKGSMRAARPCLRAPRWRESIKAVAECLGHTDPGFTLRIYTHLLPDTEDRTRSAIDAALGTATAPGRPGAAAKG